MEKSNDKLMYTVEEIFTNYLTENSCEYYNIPDYQRGYKWTKNNIRELLDDLKNFKDACRDEQEKQYCLQNITICASQEGKCYNVVDGQQRLTTLTILLSYLKRADLVENKIKYSVREETHRFISEQIINGNIWQSEPQIKHKDQYYLNEVAQAIKSWFESPQAPSSQEMLEIVRNKVFLIVNKLSTDEEQIFAQLNGAKVNLDGADLLRATMMTRSAKEKFGSTSSQIQINEFRIRMGLEIDDMNKWWGQKEVSAFFSQMIPQKTAKEAKDSGFDIKTFPINILYVLLYENIAQNNKEFSFKFFEYGLDKDGKPGNDNWELYAELKKLHLEMQDWFTNKYIYHYLGYLFFNYKEKNKFSDIYQKWQEIHSKQKFIEYLKEQMISCLIASYKEKDSTEALDKLYSEITDIKHDWYNENKELFSCLILQDIITFTENKSESLSRMPVLYFTRANEDKEHIGCQTPNKKDCENKEKWREYIATLKELYPDINADACRMEKILDDNDNIYDEQQSQLIAELNRHGLNSIGNMVLLDEHINRSYGNNSFADKRLEITRNYYNDRFIRPYTFKVFIKAENQCNMNHWTLEDIKQNAQNIADSIKQWIQK